ncbi:glucose-6-phosphate isomerase [Candidatus Poribacteria bacterium]|nr:glucose-6-phosphate isomerase [Candidatus Poribacteria bacterium]
MINPQETKSYAKLKELSQNPFDLTAPNALSPQRINTMKLSAVGFDFLYATQRITNEVLAALQQLADETYAVDQYTMMMSGEIMNRIEGHESENRQVLHTASRNIFDDLACQYDCRQADAVKKARAQLKRLKEFLDELDSGAIRNTQGETFTDMIQVGIGGSDLGPRAIYLGLQAYRQNGRRVHFISNVDPDDAVQILKEVDLSRTLVNVVSKSGTTLETLTNERLIADRFIQAGLDVKKHFIAVTGEGSPMDDLEEYLRSFYMYDYIGGRYSATSMVGGVALGFGLGYDNFMEILRGARKMDLNALKRDIRQNIALLTALIGIWNRNFLGYETLAILPYSQALIRFVAHLQQLDMESNGKRINRQGKVVEYDTGPVVWGEPGTNGQHAFYQLIHQSNTIIPIEFIGFRQSQYGGHFEFNGTTSQEKLIANLLAQSRALATGQKCCHPNKFFPGNRPNSILIADKLTPFTMGALLAYYENKVAFQGFIWNINSFDQEGVQLGKLSANKFTDHFRAKAADANYSGAEKDPIGWAMMKSAGNELK